MKSKILGIFISLSLLLFIACEKDKICIENVPCTSNEYMPLAIGNYWIYEVQDYDLNTYAITTLPWCDTIKVIGDTIIRNQHYFTLRSTEGLFFNYLDDISFLRDSVGYIINDSGEILFSDSDFDRPLNRTNMSTGDDGERFIEYAIKDTTFVRITPAGVFGCLDYRGQAWTGLAWDDDKVYHNCFAKDVGLIYQSAFFIAGPISPPIGTPPTNEGRRLLKEYNIE